MADAITIKALQDASLDAKSLEEVVNGDEAKQVTTRLGETYPSVKKAIKQMFENGGLPATPFDTLVQMQASPLQDGSYAIVISDAGKEGFYHKESGEWVKVPLNMFTSVEIDKLNIDFLKLILNATEVDTHKIINWVTGFNAVNNTVSTSVIDKMYENGGSYSDTHFALLKPNTKYVVYKPRQTNMFRIAVFDSNAENLTYTKRIGNGDRLRRLQGGKSVMYDDINTGLVSFETKDDGGLLYLTVAHQSYDDGSATLLEIGSATNIKTPKNLYDPSNVLTDVGIAIKNGEDSFVYETMSIGSNKLVTYYMPVKANTTYTVSKDLSTKFFIGEVVDYFDDIALTRKISKVFSDPSAVNHTFTTSNNALYLVVYVSNTGERPNLQLEYGSTATAYKPYVPTKKINNIFTETSSDVNYSGTFANLHYFAHEPEIVTQKLQSAISNASGSTLYIQSGTYQLDGTLTIPSNTKVIGLGKVRLEFVSQANMTRVNWRSLPVKAYVLTSTDSKNVTLENIEVAGIPTLDNALHWGICIQGSEHTLNNVSVYDVNWIDSENREPRAGGNGWGLVFYKAQGCRVVGGRFEGSGYENVGTDNASDIVFDSIYCGKGWRTSFQVHRVCHNIKLLNSVIEQVSSSADQTHAAVTIHGTKSNPVTGVTIDNCVIDAQISANQGKRCGGIQSVEAGEYDVTITNTKITTNKFGISSASDSVGYVHGWIITGCRVDGESGTITYRGNNSIITNNILSGGEDIRLIDSSSNVITENNIFI